MPASRPTSSTACKKERIKHILDLCISRFNAFSRLQNELDQTKTALEERKVIDRAKGILMKAKNLTEEEAYALLRKTAMNEKQEDRRDRAIGHHRRGDVQMSDADTSCGSASSRSATRRR